MRSPGSFLVVATLLACQKAPADAPAASEETKAPVADTRTDAPEKKRAPFAERAPKVGEPAPDFTLAQLGGGQVTLSEVAPNGPVVLMFGSFS